MATLILGAAGAALGGSIGGTVLGVSAATIGGFVGSTIGSVVDSWAVAASVPGQWVEGPRLESLRVTSSTEGAVIPRVWGRMRIGGTISHAAQIAALSAGDWSSAGSRDASLVFRTRRANTLEDRLTIAASGTLRLPGIGTTAGSANAFLDPGDGNALLRSTSSERYKRDIEDVEPSRAEALLDLRPVWYRSTAPADRPDWSWYGLLAEEVAVVDPRLVHWGYQDRDYETVATVDPETGEAVSTRCLKPDAMLVPDGVQYERLTVLLIDVVRRLRAQVEALEARVVVLEGRDG